MSKTNKKDVKMENIKTKNWFKILIKTNSISDTEITLHYF